MEPKQPMVFIDDEKLSSDIQERLAKAGTQVDKHVIRLIMQYQTDNYENLGIIRIIRRKP